MSIVCDSKPSVLLVDDTEDVRLLARCLLSRAGFEVSEADSGTEAQSRLSARDLPDVMLLDVQMPRMDGWQTLAAIREEPATADLAVVLWTVRGRPEDVLRGWETGCDGYLSKPFDAHELEDEVRRVIALTTPERMRARAARLAEARQLAGQVA